MTASTLRALIVAYAFPPVGGAGVQRIAKLVKYLPRYGIDPSVLTAKNSSVPLTDETLTSELPPTLDVERTRTLEPGYAVKQAAWNASGGGDAPTLASRAKRALVTVAKNLLVPDPQILWQPSAQWALGRRLLADPPDIVFISGPPFSQFLLGPLAQLGPKTAVIFDYRDEWSTYRSTYEMTSAWSQRFSDHLERTLLRTADAVTTATESFRDELCRRFPFVDRDTVHAIPNGYDPDDFPRQLPRPPTDRLVLTYAGTVFRLTSMQGLLGAIRRLAARIPDLGRRMEVRFIGRIVGTEAHHFEGMEALGVRRLGYMSHGEVLQQLAASHVVLCALDDVPGAERIYPAKIFELMHLGRPALVLAPKGALTALVERHHMASPIHPRNEEAIADRLEQLLRHFERKHAIEPSRPAGVERYTREALAGNFASVFRQAAERWQFGPAGDSTTRLTHRPSMSKDGGAAALNGGSPRFVPRRSN